MTEHKDKLPWEEEVDYLADKKSHCSGIREFFRKLTAPFKYWDKYMTLIDSIDEQLVKNNTTLADMKSSLDKLVTEVAALIAKGNDVPVERLQGILDNVTTQATNFTTVKETVEALESSIPDSPIPDPVPTPERKHR